VLCFFLARVYGVTFAAIAALLLATLPGSIERSAAGFGDRDAWCWMLGIFAVTSYLYKEGIEPGQRRWIATALAGFTVFLGGLSWEGFGFFVLMIVGVELWKFCSTDTESDPSVDGNRTESAYYFKEYFLYMLMFVPWLYLISPAYRSGYGFSTHVAALMLLPLRCSSVQPSFAHRSMGG
jgi:asparagine N-glycosylation enzyme membrane subunit Stt3